MKITLQFPKGEVATLERGAWNCADETLFACCKVAVLRYSAETQTDLFLRTVRRFAGRMSASLTIEIPPNTELQK